MDLDLEASPETPLTGRQQHFGIQQPYSAILPAQNGLRACQLCGSWPGGKAINLVGVEAMRSVDFINRERQPSAIELEHQQAVIR